MKQDIHYSHFNCNIGVLCIQQIDRSWLLSHSKYWTCQEDQYLAACLSGRVPKIGKTAPLKRSRHTTLDIFREMQPISKPVCHRYSGKLNPGFYWSLVWGDLIFNPPEARYDESAGASFWGREEKRAKLLNLHAHTNETLTDLNRNLRNSLLALHVFSLPLKHLWTWECKPTGYMFGNLKSILHSILYHTHFCHYLDLLFVAFCETFPFRLGVEKACVL